MHTFAPANGILVFVRAFFLYAVWFPGQRPPRVDHAPNAGLVEAYTYRSNSTPDHIIWVCKLDFEKFDFIWFQLDKHVYMYFKSPALARLSQ